MLLPNQRGTAETSREQSRTVWNRGGWLLQQVFSQKIDSNTNKWQPRWNDITWTWTKEEQQRKADKRAEQQGTKEGDVTTYNRSTCCQEASTSTKGVCCNRYFPKKIERNTNKWQPRWNDVAWINASPSQQSLWKTNPPVWVPAMQKEIPNRKQNDVPLGEAHLNLWTLANEQLLICTFDN